MFMVLREARSINKAMLLNSRLHLAPIARRLYTVATSLPLGEVLGLAIGGTALVAFLTTLAIFLARRNDRRKREDVSELDAEGSKENNLPLRTTQNSLCLSQKSSFNPFLPPEQASVAMSNEWLEDESMIDSPPMTKARARRLSQKGLFQMSGMRDSWPLAASMPNVPLCLLNTNSSTVTLNQAGGGGYVVPPEPKWPGRTYSRKSKTRIIVAAEEPIIQRFSTSSNEIAPRVPTRQRRSASVNQLSTILRSTSQRLKAAHRKSLSRTLTNIGGSAGSPPSDKLNTPHKPTSGSRVCLVEPGVDDAETVTSSICDASQNPSPSASAKNGRKSIQSSLRRRSSVTASLESVDSLCARATPDQVIPAALTSPSNKLIKGPQCHGIHRASEEAKELSGIVPGKVPASAFEVGDKGSFEEKVFSTKSHHTSSISDPFYSAVQSGKRAVPQNEVTGPRPLYVRQATFGHEATVKRPTSSISSSASPLQMVSGNAQSSSNLTSSTDSVASESSVNPFDWDPEKAMATRIQQNPSRSSGRRRGHKRSNVVRISLQPRPPYVSPLAEDPEEDASPLTFNIPPNAPMRANNSAKSPSPKPSSISSHRLSSRPSPSSMPLLDPVLPIPEKGKGQRHSANDLPILALDSPPQIYSPTLALTNFYSEARTSEVVTFISKPGEASTPLDEDSLDQKHHTIAALPHLEHKELVSFPRLALNTSSNPRISPSPPRPATATSSRLAVSPALLDSPQALPAPTLIQSSPSPSHPIGPRLDPAKLLPTSSVGPKDSLLHQSICMLRRMNSEVSRCSSVSNDDEEGRISPRLPSHASLNSSNWGRRFEKQSRGSKAYLSMGMNETQRRRKAGKQESPWRDKLSEKQKIQELEGESDEVVRQECKGLETMGKFESLDVTTEQVKRGEGVLENGQIPTLSCEGENEEPTRQDPSTSKIAKQASSSTISPLRIARWSDATPSPTIKAIRHESQLLQPSPQSPPSWGWSNLNGSKEGVKRLDHVMDRLADESPVKKNYGNWNGNFGRPDSLGLYDADGFLMSSPGRQGLAGA